MVKINVILFHLLSLNNFELKNMKKPNETKEGQGRRQYNWTPNGTCAWKCNFIYLNF